MQLEYAENGNHRQRISEKQRTGISHENACRIEIERQEAEAGAEQNRTDNCTDEISLKHDHKQEGQRRNRRYPARKTVQTVNKVDGVGQPGNPENAQRSTQNAERDVHTAEVDVVNHASVAYRKNSNGKLYDQFEPSVEAVNIVENPQDHDNAPADPDGRQFLGRGTENNGGQREAEVNGKSADPRHGLFVNAPVIQRNVHRADPERENTYNGCHGIRQQSGADNGDDTV